MNIYILITVIIFLLVVFVLIGVYSKKKKKIPTLTTSDTSTKADYLTLCDSSLPYVKPIHYPDILTKEECKLLKKLSTEKGFEESKVKNNEKDSTRTSETCWLSDSDHPFLYELNERFEKLIGIGKYAFEALQVVRYYNNNSFQSHFDQCFKNEEYCQEELQRFNGRPRDRTLIIYLNEPSEYEGGETVFDNLGVKYKEPVGTGILFENLDESKTYVHPKAKHTGSTVISGEKWICNLWIRS
jgi:prolyl 4-hydroxylase